MAGLRKRLGGLASPGTVLGIVALCVSLTGTAFAAGLIGSADVRNNSLRGIDIKNKSLTKQDFRGAVRGARGPQGLTGPTGSAGATGATGPTGTFSTGSITTRTASTVQVAPGTVGSAAAECAPGEIAISGGAQTGGTDSFQDIWIVATQRNLNSTTNDNWTVYLYNNDNDATPQNAALIVRAECLAP